MNKPIYYEKHPVSAERRAALIGQGFKIIDIKFKPDDYKNPSDDDFGDNEGNNSSLNMTVDEIKAKLDELGIEYPQSAKKQELLDLLNNESDSE